MGTILIKAETGTMEGPGQWFDASLQQVVEFGSTGLGGGIFAKVRRPPARCPRRNSTQPAVIRLIRYSCLSALPTAKSRLTELQNIASLLVMAV